MIYSLDANEIKKIIDAKLSNKSFDEAQFLYYHLYRNYFNIKDEVKTLKKIEGKKYLDNMNNIWEETSVFKNFYHMPKTNWVGSIIGISTPYSRKFLRDDNISGIGGEFEMIIRQDGKRVDALIDAKYQETYNFGRTRNVLAHKTLDVDTHNVSGDYTFRQDMGNVIIKD